jgi:hypothetical protein
MFVCSSRVKWRDSSDINWLYRNYQNKDGKHDQFSNRKKFHWKLWTPSTYLRKGKDVDE